MALVRTSRPKQFSKCVTICVSGYTSENENKQIKWEKVTHHFTHEVYTLDWKSGTMKELQSFISQNAIETGVASALTGSVLPVVLNFAKMMLSNPFSKAFKEAQLVGQVLGQLLGNQQIFKY